MRKLSALIAIVFLLTVLPEFADATMPPMPPSDKPAAGIKNGLQTPKIKIDTLGYSALKIKWKKVKGANGYEVFRTGSVWGGYKKVKTIKGGSAAWTNSKLKKHAGFYYKVRAFKYVKGKKKYSHFSGWREGVAGTRNVAVKALALQNTVNTTNLSITIGDPYYNFQNAHNGFEVYRSETKEGSYKKVASVKEKDDTAFYKDKSVAPLKTYYYKVRAYRVVGKRVLKGDYKTVKTKAVNGMPQLTSKVIFDPEAGDQFKLKLKSNQYNKVVTLLQKNGRVNAVFYYKDNIPLKIIGYSYDDVSYSSFHKSIEIKAGQIMYLQLQAATQIDRWNKGYISIPFDYARLKEEKVFDPMLQINNATGKVTLSYYTVGICK